MSVIVSREFWLIGPRFSQGVSAALRPEIESAEEMKPEVDGAEDLKPDIGAVITPQVASVEMVPDVTTAEDLKPDVDPQELKPSISSVTEE